MKKVLIVDDMKEVYDKLKCRYADSEYSSSVNDAVRKIKEGVYTQVITDYNMGEEFPKGGLKILEECARKGIESILMSTENHEKEASKYGAKFVFKKKLIKDGTR